jgi:hypothetical protein
LQDADEAGGQMYCFNYVESRDSNDTAEVRTSGATRLESLIASAKSQFVMVKRFHPRVIGFYITDDQGNEVARWHAADETS